MISENARAYLNSFVRDVRQIDTLRRIETSLLLLGLSFALATEGWRTFIALGTSLVLGFAFLELVERREIQLRAEQAESHARQSYISYSAPAAAAPLRVTLRARLRAVVYALTLPNFLMWNLALLCFLLLVSLMA